MRTVLLFAARRPLRFLLSLFCFGLAAGSLAGPLANVFDGTAIFVEDEEFSVPTSSRFHAEYSTAFFNGQYHMYFRTFRHLDGTYGEIAGIGLLTSADGKNWTAYNGGRAVIAPRIYTDGSGTHQILFYAPTVIAETVDGVPRLTMLYEALDEGVTSYGSSRPRHWIEGATSTDGITWQTINDQSNNPRKILVSAAVWEGYAGSAHVGNVGTPSLTKAGDTYYVTYHGFRGTDGPGALARGIASGTSLENLTRHPANPILTVPGNWANIGVGRADLAYEDGYWYMVFEGLGNSALCGAAQLGWGLARSTDLATWELSGRNPVRLDRVATGCGEDMPSFQKIGSEIYVLTTTSDLSEIPAVRRYRIEARPRGWISTNVVAMAAPTAGDGYWQVTEDGRVLNWGAAPALGSTAVFAPVRVVDIAATLSGQGYWIALSNGGVRAFGDATFYGSMEGLPLHAPVTGLAPTPDGQGYWLVAEDGGIFTFGNAGFHGSLGASPPASPVVEMAVRAGGNGYWLVSADGTVYEFGAAPDHGSLGPGSGAAVDIQSSGSGNGYWVVTQDGHVHRFGDAPLIGSTNGAAPSLLAGAAWRKEGSAITGCWLTAVDGVIVEFGSSRYHGDPYFSLVSPSAAREWMRYE